MEHQYIELMIYFIGGDDSVRVPEPYIKGIFASQAFTHVNHIAHFRFAVIGIRDIVDGNIGRSK